MCCTDIPYWLDGALRAQRLALSVKAPSRRLDGRYPNKARRTGLRGEKYRKRSPDRDLKLQPQAMVGDAKLVGRFGMTIRLEAVQDIPSRLVTSMSIALKAVRHRVLMKMSLSHIPSDTPSLSFLHTSPPRCFRLHGLGMQRTLVGHAVTRSGRLATASGVKPSFSPCRFKSTTASSSTTPPAFIFDIDGVLKIGKKVLPQGKEVSSKRSTSIICKRSSNTLDALPSCAYLGPADTFGRQ